MSTDSTYRRLVRRETHSSRAGIAITIAVLLILVLVLFVVARLVARTRTTARRPGPLRSLAARLRRPVRQQENP